MSVSVTINNYTLSYKVNTTITSEGSQNTIVRFPGMSGGVVQRGGRRYERVSIEAWLDGTTMAAIIDEFDQLSEVLGELLGTHDDTVAIEYGDGSTVTLRNVVQIGQLTADEPAYYDGVYVRAVRFELERLQ